MIKSMVIIAIVMTSLFSYGSAKDKKLLRILNAEIVLIRNNQFRDDQLQYRYIELHSQKLKIIRRLENEVYLKESSLGKNRKQSKNYFAKSDKVYRTIVAYSAGVLKKRKGKHRFSQDIFYLLGHLDSIYNKSKLAYILYGKILQGKKTAVYYKAAAALGQLHYNQKNFQEAMKFYTMAIINKKDHLRSKYLYLLSWAELKLQKNGCSNETS